MKEFWNWARTFSCRPKFYFEPNSIEILREILLKVQENQWKIRVIGCGHSPSSLALSNDVLISMKYFNKILEINQINQEIHCQSGIDLSSLNEILPEHNLSLPVQGSVSGITLGGAISTATHGSGLDYGSLSSYVRSITLMKLDGTIEEFQCNDENKEKKDLFYCLSCSLGTFGIILSIRLELSKLFYLKLNQHQLEFHEFLNHLPIYLSSSDHFRYMWYPHTNQGIAYHVQRINPIEIKQTISFFSKIISWFRYSFIGHHLLEFLFYLSLSMPKVVHWINKIYLKIDGKTFEKIDRCDRIFNFDCLFRQYASEWAIPLDETVSCLIDLEKIIENYYVHFPIEIRFNKNETSSYLSPCYQRKTCWINIVSYRPYGINHYQHRAFFQNFENICLKYNGRPHWAKEHPLTNDQLSKLYPKWKFFNEKRQDFDPKNLLINDCLSKIFH